MVRLLSEQVVYEVSTVTWHYGMYTPEEIRSRTLFAVWRRRKKRSDHVQIFSRSSHNRPVFVTICHHESPIFPSSRHSHSSSIPQILCVGPTYIASSYDRSWLVYKVDRGFERGLDDQERPFRVYLSAGVNARVVPSIIPSDWNIRRNVVEYVIIIIKNTHSTIQNFWFW